MVTNYLAFVNMAYVYTIKFTLLFLKSFSHSEQSECEEVDQVLVKEP